MKKILIFGLPRTGTTVLQHYLSTKLKLTNLLEPYTEFRIRSQYIDWTKDLKSGIVKILTSDLITSIFPVNMPQIMGLEVFDKIVVVHRSNYIDICLSLYYANRVVDKYQWKKEEIVQQIQFDVDRLFVDYFVKEYRVYKKTLEWFDSAKISYDKFDYDLFLEGKSQTILDQNIVWNELDFEFKKSKIDYKELCRNYEQVKDWLKSSLGS